MSDFDDRLRAWGAAESAAVGPHPPLSLVRRRRWQPFVVAAAVAALVGAVAVVAAERPGTAPVLSAAAVPWADLPPGPDVAPTAPPTAAPTAPPCRPDDLAARFGGNDGLTGGQLLRYVVLTSRSRARCLLDAEVTSMTAVRGGVRQRLSLSRSHDGFGPSPGVLQEGNGGLLVLSYNISCGGDPSHVALTRTYTDVQLTLGGVVLPVAAGDLEGGKLSFCSADVSTTRAGVEAQPEPPLPPDPRADLTPSVTAPNSVRAGSVLLYTVALSNNTGSTIALDRCPNFLQTLAAAKDVHALNCRAADPIPAGGQESFAMQFRVPANTVNGPATLRWSLALGLGARAPASADVVVTGGEEPVVTTANGPQCTPASTTAPCPAGMEPGTAYSYVLETHCGIVELYADGLRWVVDDGQQASDGSGNPPPGIDNPFDAGTAVLRKPGVRLEWTSRSGRLFSFHPRTSSDPRLSLCD